MILVLVPRRGHFSYVFSLNYNFYDDEIAIKSEDNVECSVLHHDSSK